MVLRIKFGDKKKQNQFLAAVKCTLPRAAVIYYIIFFITPIGSKTIKSKTQDTYILKLSTQAYMSIKHNTNT